MSLNMSEQPILNPIYRLFGRKGLNGLLSRLNALLCRLNALLAHLNCLLPRLNDLIPRLIPRLNSFICRLNDRYIHFSWFKMGLRNDPLIIYETLFCDIQDSYSTYIPSIFYFQKLAKMTTVCYRIMYTLDYISQAFATLHNKQTFITIIVESLF